MRILGLALLLAACGAGRSDMKVVGPNALMDKDFDEWNIDPKIERLYGKSSPLGKLPLQLSWSPDSQRAAFVRAAYENADTKRLELWVFDMATKVERPIFADKTSVTEYTWAGSETVVVTAGGDLFQAAVDGGKKQLTRTEAAETSIAGSPDGSKVAFVREHDLYVIDLLTGGERRLTKGGSRLRTHGEVTWLYQEELDTEVGLGWSADSAKLWFYQTDLSEVVFRDIQDRDGTIQRVPYPRPGEKNPRVRVGVLDLQQEEEAPIWITPETSDDTYLPFVQWHPDSDRLLVVSLDRLQTTLELLLCPSEERKCDTVFSERDPRYVNLLGHPLVFNKGKEMLWLSEQNGYSHIYRIRLEDGAAIQLTDGQWVVTEINWIDEKGEAVLFTANPEDPASYKLYRASLDGEGDVEGLSSETGCHEVLFSPNGRFFLDTHSALDRPPRIDVKTCDGDIIDVLAKSDISQYEAPDVMSQIFPFETANGETLYALLTRPKAIRQDTRYPVLIIVYGGPHWQLARSAFNLSFQPLRDLLALRGILVFSVDGHGSFGRGRDFENAIRLELGKTELKDQLEGVRYLKTLPFVDPHRIGIFGWSYGGTMVLQALLSTKEVFKLGVAVAPVTDWRLYDTAYTERYMQRPTDNPDGYRASSLLSRAKSLSAPLLLVHGIADENVHFVHSARLFEAFVTAGKHVDTLFYPGKSHKLSGPATRSHLFSTVTRFIEERL